MARVEQTGPVEITLHTEGGESGDGAL